MADQTVTEICPSGPAREFSDPKPANLGCQQTTEAVSIDSIISTPTITSSQPPKRAFKRRRAFTVSGRIDETACKVPKLHVVSLDLQPEQGESKVPKLYSTQPQLQVEGASKVPKSATQPLLDDAARSNVNNTTQNRKRPSMLDLQKSIDNLKASVNETVAQSITSAMLEWQTTFNAQVTRQIERAVDEGLSPIHMEIQQLRNVTGELQGEVKDLSALKNKLSKYENQTQSLKGQIKKLEYEYKGLRDITGRMNVIDDMDNTANRSNQVELTLDRMPSLY